MTIDKGCRTAHGEAGIAQKDGGRGVGVGVGVGRRVGGAGRVGVRGVGRGRKGSGMEGGYGVLLVSCRLKSDRPLP